MNMFAYPGLLVRFHNPNAEEINDRFVVIELRDRDALVYDNARIWDGRAIRPIYVYTLMELTAAPPVEQAALLLNAECKRLGLAGLDMEQEAALSDPNQWPAMLDDLEARCGLNVQAARDWLKQIRQDA